LFSICIAGHINHGKTAIAKELTGINTDRLPEENARGISIELGYAKYKIDKKNYCSIIDAPGHENFVHNMIKGAYGVDLVMLVISANEGIQRQTIEHFEIIKSLDIANLIIVINKIDLSHNEQIEKTESEIKKSFLNGKYKKSKIINLSCVTKEGMTILESEIKKMFNAKKTFEGLPVRVPIDRVFSLPGKGTIVTGTLLGSDLEINTQLRLMPANKKIKIKKIESFYENIEKVKPGSRCALNLHGIEKNEIKKGDIICSENYFVKANTFYGEISTINPNKKLKNNSEIIFHSGTNRSPGKIRIIYEINSGKKIYKIILKKDLAIFNNDNFIIRNNMGTVGGGKIICVENLSNLNNEKLTDYLRNINADVEKKIETIIREKKIISIERLQTLSGLSKNNIFDNIEKTEITTFQIKNKNQYLAKKHFIMELSKGMFLKINEYHKQYPLRRGISASIINESIENRISITQLINLKKIVLKEGVISNLNFRIGIPAKDKREIDAYIKSLEENPFNPPTDKHPNKELLNYLIKIGAIIQSSNNIYYSFNSFNKIKDKVLELNKKHKKININILRENLKISRKYCLAILDKMEEEKLIIRTKT